jgi:RNA polymerase sigma-70 factor (ECF subfamily)
MTSSRSHSEDDAVRRVAGGDKAAFERLYRQYQSPILWYHLKRTGNREVAFDLTAETFAAALIASESFDPRKGSAAGWLFGIAHHKLVDSVRRGVVESAARSALAMREVVVSDDDLDRIDELASLSSEQTVSDMLAALPEEQRLSIMARVVDEQPYSVIAADMKCSPAVVRQRVARGMKTLRREMGATR